MIVRPCLLLLGVAVVSWALGKSWNYITQQKKISLNTLSIENTVKLNSKVKNEKKKMLYTKWKIENKLYLNNL